MERRSGLAAALLIGLLPAALSLTTAATAEGVPLPSPAPQPKSYGPPSAAQQQQQQRPPAIIPPPGQPQRPQAESGGGLLSIFPKPPALFGGSGSTTAFDARQRQLADRVSAYLSNVRVLSGKFVQVGPDGSKSEGEFYLQKPGRVRFDYNPPSPIELIADGQSVVVRDRKLATQDLYSISQTPLKFLLRERVNLGQDIRIAGITNDGSGVRINLEDSSTLGGTSRITLFFDPQIENLSQWRIVDAQGFQTMVVLDKVERGRRIDQDLFKIQYETIIGNNR
jgi:outer membrane lipoprotein-sorting protein